MKQDEKQNTELGSLITFITKTKNGDFVPIEENQIEIRDNTTEIHSLQYQNCEEYYYSMR